MFNEINKILKILKRKLLVAARVCLEPVNISKEKRFKERFKHWVNRLDLFVQLIFLGNSVVGVTTHNF